MNETCVLKTELPKINLFNRGKVRDVYEVNDLLFIVTTDRVSAFDCIIPNGLPEKGKILTDISLFWFRFMDGKYPHHLISANFDDFPDVLQPYKKELEGRTLCVKKAKPLPIEFIVRGYLTGSAWKEYQDSGTVCGLTLPSGLQKDQKFDEPLFTPSTKAKEGHDENISFEQCQEIIGKDLAIDLKERSLNLYKDVFSYAKDRGILVCDTKFEFGFHGDEVIFIDEVLTPDSSRFWELKDYKVGQSNKSFDKQIIRDHLNKTDWNKEYPAPFLPENIILSTLERYKEIVERLKS